MVMKPKSNLDYFMKDRVFIVPSTGGLPYLDDDAILSEHMDTTIILIGDIDIHKEVNPVLFQSLSFQLNERGCNLMILRGPFDDKNLYTNSIHYGVILLIKDYSVINNIMFVGGGVSANRNMYSSHNYPVKQLDYPTVGQLTDAYDIKTLVLYNAPEGVHPIGNTEDEVINIEIDKNLPIDIYNERKYLEKIMSIINNSSGDSLMVYYTMYPYSEMTTIHDIVLYPIKEETKFH